MNYHVSNKIYLKLELSRAELTLEDWLKVPKSVVLKVIGSEEAFLANVTFKLANLFVYMSDMALQMHCVS